MKGIDVASSSSEDSGSDSLTSDEEYDDYDQHSISKA